VNKIYLKEISSISLWDQAKPVLTDKNQVLMAETKFGKGFVFAVGDPWIYNEYIDHKYLTADFDNLKAANNLVEYLLNKK
jgi:unsaturated rhamnogalacturonyl hydrolase